MTACVNRKHTKKVAAVVTASLVGALSLGVAPVAAMAEDTGIELQFADPEKAFKDAKIVNVSWTRSDMRDADGDGVYEVEYKRNVPVALSQLKLNTFGTGVTADLTISATDDDYTIEYFKRGEDGYPTGDPITSDIVDTGEYVAVVTAVDGAYKDGVYYVPFDIDAIQLNNIVVKDSDVLYNAETHTFDFAIDSDGDGVYDDDDEKLYPGDDYDVEYIETGHDKTNVKDVKNVGTYKAIITGKGAYEGTVELSQLITVHELNLTDATVSPSKVQIIGLTSSSSSVEPKNLYAIVIDGVVYSGDDPIMSELKAELDDTTAVWSDNGKYDYNVTAVKPSDGNITGTGKFTATKVSYDLSITYNGAAIADSYDVFVTGGAKWDSNKLAGHAADGTVNGVDKKASDFKVTFYDENGNTVSESDVNTYAGTYTAVIECIDGAAEGYKVGGVAFTTINTYKEAVDADATSAVLYDTNGDGVKEVVSSINGIYNDGFDYAGAIDVVVKTSTGATLREGTDYEVSYYNAAGEEVGKLINAGTYTLKVTSKTYKLSGTTEMAITIGKADFSTVRSDEVETIRFDTTDKVIEYLPWTEDGYAIADADRGVQGLDLQYLPAGADASKDSSWLSLEPYFTAFKVTILDANGDEVEKITDEGVYTIHFEARNEDAVNNYVVPEDLTITCIKFGDNSKGEINHLLFADVQYTDYFADAVSAVNSRDFMNGYNGTKLFGSYDQLTRGQVACILYNVATYAGQVDESELVYNELVGYDTGFSDVNGKAYYGRAIAWAKQAGVVNGYGDGTFAPDAPVTREEFAAMMMNYASKFDQDYKAVTSTDVLDSFDDANGVSDWAEEVVAWAVENGIMGNGGFLNAQGDIIRADAACMVYNYAFDE